MLKVIELFSGIGAQKEALKIAGIPHEVVATSEIDKYAIKTYRFLHGWTTNLGDIKTIKELPQVDLWTYSFPCTDISLSGRLKGFEKGSETGSSLLWEVQRLLEVSKEKGTLPKVLLMENVKNLVSKRFINEFLVWVDYLKEQGYKSFYKVLNAKDYGVPQNRERTIMISILNYDGDFIFPSPQELKVSLQDLLEKEVDEKYFLSDRFIKYACDLSNRNGFIRGTKFRPHDNKSKVAYTISTCPGGRATDNFVMIPAKNISEEEKEVILVPQATKAGYAAAEVGDGVYTNRCKSKRGVVQKSIIPTLKCTVTDVGVVVNDKNDLINIRRLTPRECWRLMGWNDERIDRAFEAGCSETQYYKMAGNSIVVNVLVEVFKSLKNCINIT